MRVLVVSRDLLFYSRIDAAFRRHDHEVRRVDGVDDLSPGPTDLLLVDWTERQPEWGPTLKALMRDPRGPRVVLYGSHTDLAAHADARTHGVGPMWARSKLVAALPALASADVDDPHQLT